MNCRHCGEWLGIVPHESVGLPNPGLTEVVAHTHTNPRNKEHGTVTDYYCDAECFQRGVTAD